MGFTGVVLAATHVEASTSPSDEAVKRLVPCSSGSRLYSNGNPDPVYILFWVKLVWDNGVHGNPDPSFINPLPLIEIILGILILRHLKGGGLLAGGLHNSRMPFRGLDDLSLMCG